MTLSRRKRFLQRSAVLKKWRNIKWTCFQQKDRIRIKSTDKLGLEERATQSWDLVGTEGSKVTFLLQFSLWYCWCFQGYLSRQQHCSRNELWAHKTVIHDHLWNCTLLQAVTGCGSEKGSMFCSVIWGVIQRELHQEQMDFTIRYLRMLKSWPDICLQHFLDILL